MSKKHAIKINQGRLIPLWLRLIIVAILFLGMVYANIFMSEGYAVILSIGFAAPVLPVWNAFSLLEVDNQAKAYFKGSWLAGFRWGSWQNYDAIKEIIIRDSIEDRVKKEFRAYLVFKNDLQIYLIGHDSKDKLDEHLFEINKKLGLKNQN